MTELEIEGLNVFYAIDKLKNHGITVYRARRTQKNALTVQVRGKDVKKVFAIFSVSCYNIKKIMPCGIARLKKYGVRYAGLLLGAALFCGCVLFAQGRVLRIEVTGSGKSYAQEVVRILASDGITRFSPMPDVAAHAVSRILALPHVSYCSLHGSGGILTVEVEVDRENALADEKELLSPAAGEICALTVVRGSARKAVGDYVEEGDVLVGASDTSAIVIACVTVRYAVSDLWEGTREEALARALLSYAELDDVRVVPEGNGWRVSGVAYARAAVNL